MTWSQVQQKRLQTEKRILKKYFPTFKWLNPTDPDNTQVEGNIRSNAKNIYRLRIYIPSDYPNSRPEMVIISPNPVKGYLGKDLKEYGASRKMHILSPKDEYVQICHYKDWLPNLTIYLVVLKGRIWLEALEAHTRTGKSLDKFLSHMKKGA